jgi:hypothetical protein
MDRPTPPVLVREINLKAKSLPDESRSRIRVPTCARIFRSLSARDQETMHFCQLDWPFSSAEIRVCRNDGVSIDFISKVVTKRNVSIQDDVHVGTEETCVSPPRPSSAVSEEARAILWITKS